MIELTPFQQQLVKAAEAMILSQTISGIAIKETKAAFMALVEKAVDSEEMSKLLEQMEWNRLSVADRDKLIKDAIK